MINIETFIRHHETDTMRNWETRQKRTKRQRNISLYQTFLQLFCPNNLYCVEWGVKLYSLTHWNKLPADNVLSDSESGFKLRL